MLKDVFFIVTRDLSHLLRRRETLVWTFVMPVIAGRLEQSWRKLLMRNGIA